MSLGGLRIGDLDRRFQFENFVETIDPIGNTRVESYSTAFTVHGKFTTNRGSEVFESSQQTATNSCEVMVRYNNLIVPTMRFRDLMESEYYDVRSVEKRKREGVCIVQGERRNNGG